MKKILIFANIVALSSSMMAMDLEYFLGTDVEKSKINFEIVETNGVDTLFQTVRDDASNIKLKAGVILDKTHRMSLSHINYDVEGDGGFRVILGNYDCLIPVNNEFRLFVGLHLGHLNYKDDDLKMSGLAYGTQIGAIYDITKNIELEVGEKYTKYNADDTFVSGNFNIKAEVEDSTSLFAGLNYKF